MGDSAKKKTIRIDSIHCSVRTPIDSPHHGFWTLVLKLLDQSTKAMPARPARIATELLVATLTRM